MNQPQGAAAAGSPEQNRGPLCIISWPAFLFSAFLFQHVESEAAFHPSHQVDLHPVPYPHLHGTICMYSFPLDSAEMGEHMMNCQWHESNPDCLNASHFPPAKSLLLCSFLPHTRTLPCLWDLSCTQSSLWLSQLPLDNRSFFTPCRLCDAQFNINHNITWYLLLIPFEENTLEICRANEVCRGMWKTKLAPVIKKQD